MKTSAKYNFRRVVLFSLLCAFAASTVKASDTVQPFENGKINWSKGIVYAWGSASIDPSISPYRLSKELAERQAMIKAKQNLIDILKHVKLDSRISVEDLSSKIKSVGAKISNAAKVSDVKSELVREDLVRTTVTLKIYGKFTQALISYTREREAETNPDQDLIEEIRQRQSLMRATAPQQEPPDAVTLGYYSGLIIDARHTNSTPVMFPKIVDERGKEIYSFSKISPKITQKESFVAYTKDIKSALASSKAGDHPLVLRALTNRGDIAGEIIISNQDSRKVNYENKKSKFLDTGNVIIVLD